MFSDLPLRVPKFTLQTQKFKNSLCRWCSCWITIWLSLHLTLVLPCPGSSLWNVPIGFTQFSLFSSVQFINSNMVMGIRIFMETPSLEDCWPRQKNESPYYHKMETAPWPKSNWYFKRSAGKRAWWWRPRHHLPRLKNNSSAHEMETIPPDIKLVFRSLFNINTSTIRILIAKATINWHENKQIFQWALQQILFCDSFAFVYLS